MRCGGATGRLCACAGVWTTVAATLSSRLWWRVLGPGAALWMGHYDGAAIQATIRNPSKRTSQALRTPRQKSIERIATFWRTDLYSPSPACSSTATVFTISLMHPGLDASPYASSLQRNRPVPCRLPDRRETYSVKLPSKGCNQFRRLRRNR